MKVRAVSITDNRQKLAREFISEVVAPAISKAHSAGASETTINTECIGVVSEIIQMILQAGYSVDCGGNDPTIRVFWCAPKGAAITI